ncbi:MAG: radical SAM protein [Clostridia bacterium]|nr:radical SAM protein [Clostridia bacterium]
MSIQNKLAQRRIFREGVKHCTFNPDGPGVVRIHLVPPKPAARGTAPYVVILNGYYLLPLGYSWALLLSALIDAVNVYDGAELSEDDIDDIVSRTLRTMRRTYPLTPRSRFCADLADMMGVLFDIAAGGSPDAEIEQLSIRAYAAHMTAPHRMDLMVSAMTDESGCWKCNQRCKFCYAAGQGYAQVKEMSTEQWMQAIDRLREAHVPMVTFTGGEPTQREDLCALVAHARWFVTRVNTNGVLLSETLAQELRRAGLDSIQITLYSADAAVHNALVGSEHHADTLRGIENAVRAGLDVSVNTPLCRSNADYLSTLRLLHAMGVRFITLSGLICTGAARTQDSEDLTEDELLAIVKDAEAFCREHDMDMDFTSPGLIAKDKLDALGLHTPACGAALSNMAIAPDGTVVPCQSWLGTDAGLGNILNDEFERIWSHPRCLELRGMSEEQALHCPFRAQNRKGGE